MNLSEFKAWFDGFTENMKGPPTKKQWERICERVGEIQETTSTSYPVFIERYRNWHPWWVWNGASYTLSNNSNPSVSAHDVDHFKFDSNVAYNSLGKQDAEELNTSTETM